MTFSKLTTKTSGNAGQYSSRNGAKIDRIILHHCASTSLSGVLSMMSTGSREVSANYVIGNGGEIVGVVPEEYRAWTSGSASWDGRAVTFEIVNETGAPDWRISDKAFDATARMLADLSTRYGITLSRTTVVTHQELYNLHGASYPTACPGPYLQPRIDRLISLAKTYLTGSTTSEGQEEEDEMKNCGFYYTRAKDGAIVYLIANLGSGAYHEYSDGRKGKAMSGSYNNPVAAALGTGSYASITESHANAIKASCDKVRQGK